VGRKNQPIFLREGVYYARWHLDGEKIPEILSLGTGDYSEAMTRYPIVRQTGLSWTQYIKTVSGWEDKPVNTWNAISSTSGVVRFNPSPRTISDKSATRELLENAIKEGRARLEGDNWVIEITPEADFPDEVNRLKKLLTVPPLADQSNEIEKFYVTAVLQIYDDKNTAERFGRIWLQFLTLRKIVSWSQINDTLLKDFELWRTATPIKIEDRPNRAVKPPSAEVVKRHIKFLSKSFKLATLRGYLKFNPLELWKGEKYHRPSQNALTEKELIAVLSDPAWDKNTLNYGLREHPLGYTYRDIVLLLFSSCKRRSEIVEMRIEGVNFKEHYVSYLETKNKSKPGDYDVRKSFFLTPEMEKRLKKIIGSRKAGYVFPLPLNKESHLSPDQISDTFVEVCGRIVPEKKIPLKNLRQTVTKILEDAGFTDQEIDIALGHYKVSTALPFYKDASAEAVAIRLSKMTEKGVRVLSGVVKSLF
jgi:integrase